jgi:hypothetical protein
MESPLANVVKMTDWFAQLEAEKRLSSSNCLEGESPTPYSLLSVATTKRTARTGTDVLMQSHQICRSVGKYTVRTHRNRSEALHDGPQQ